MRHRRARSDPVRFNWTLTRSPTPALLMLPSPPKKEVELARHDNLVVTQQAAEPIETAAADIAAGHRRTLQLIASWKTAKAWVQLGQRDPLGRRAGEGYTPRKERCVTIIRRNI